MSLLHRIFLVLLLSGVSLSVFGRFESFDQILDHTAGAGGKWTQHYEIHDEFVGGKNPQCVLAILRSFNDARLCQVDAPIAQWARDLKAIVVVLERRFTQNSYPATGAAESLQTLLTVDQVHGDMIYFTEIVKQRHLNGQSTSVVPWIWLGNSFDGSMALWLRSKYPKSVSGSIGFASPLFATVAFDGADQQMVAALGPECSDALRDIHDRVVKQSANDETIARMFGCATGDLSVCETDGVGLAYRALRVLETALEDDEGGVFMMCESVLNRTKCGDSDNALKDYVSYESSYIDGIGLEWSTFDLRNGLKRQDPPSGASYRSLFSFKCRAIGQFQTAWMKDKKPCGVYPPQLDGIWYLSICDDFFDVDVPPPVDLFNLRYNGFMGDWKDLSCEEKDAAAPAGTNMLYVTSQGYSTNGLQVTTSSSSLIIPDPNVSPFSILLPSDPSDPNDLVEARSNVFTKLKFFLVEESNGGKTDNDTPDKKSIGAFEIMFGVLLMTVGALFGYLVLKKRVRNEYYSRLHPEESTRDEHPLVPSGEHANLDDDDDDGVLFGGVSQGRVSDEGEHHFPL
eukprot:TRINITY_DN691_c0_g5_i1.p1 TRINITY_DN691_c0_g5~~TRINITY_DN691_c0_g5_i1.p1  ORF type:complete len:598 (-),score=167.34 TRINITY_DN691_c0_g5_i1:82-1788(-)